MTYLPARPLAVPSPLRRAASEAPGFFGRWLFGGSDSMKPQFGQESVTELIRRRDNLEELARERAAELLQANEALKKEWLSGSGRRSSCGR